MSKFIDGTTSILNVSSKSIDKDCNSIIESLSKSRILFNYSVTPNTTIRYKNDKLIKENGCKITINGVKKEWIKPLVWVPLKYDLMLKCGHLKIDTYLSGNTWFGGYSGCINDFKY